MRRKAKEALAYLLATPESAYGRFHALHMEFLGRHGEGATDRLRKRPYHFLQEVGLECAVWPHLYWMTEMTETFEQWSDVRRETRRRAQRPGALVRAAASTAEAGSEDEAESGSDQEEGDDADARRTSVKVLPRKVSLTAPGLWLHV